MTISRSVTAGTVTLVAAVAVAVSMLSQRVHAQAPASSIVGAWTLNRDLSDTGNQIPERGDMRGGRRGGGGFGRGGGRGGFGGGFPGGNQFPGGGGRGGDPQDTMRRMDALRDIIDAPDRLTITQTESMVIVTAGDGRTTRHTLDWKKNKDESTNMERRSKWESGKLISEITGSGPRVTEVYAADPEHHELLVIVQVEGQGSNEASRVFHRVYEVTPAK
jgi:hypothetical protein